MRYHHFIRKALFLYLLSGLFFALSLGGFIYFTELNQRVEGMYRTMLQAKARKNLIESEIERMKREISFLKGYINRENPQLAIFNKIDSLEKLGFNISLGQLSRSGPTVFMPLTIEFQSNTLSEAMNRMKSIIQERFPLVLVDSINFSPNRERTRILVRVKARLVATGLDKRI